MILIIIGDHPRHIYLAKYLQKQFKNIAIILERREQFLPKISNIFNNSEYRLKKDLYERHFFERKITEAKFFGDNNSNDFFEKCLKNNIPIHRCEKETLNSKETIKFIELVILPKKSFNLHGGISPWYKGSITHFWPSYFLEPQMTGMTLHQLTSDLDAGGIVHQNSGVLVKGDGIHDLSCRTLKSFISELPYVINKILIDDFHLEAQKSKGKLWLSSDWRPEHLRLVYDFFNNRIVDYVLDNLDYSLKKRIIRVTI